MPLWDRVFDEKLVISSLQPAMGLLSDIFLELVMVSLGIADSYMKFSCFLAITHFGVQNDQLGTS